jgi:hypothetical protein
MLTVRIVAFLLTVLGGVGIMRLNVALSRAWLKRGLPGGTRH